MIWITTDWHLFHTELNRPEGFTEKIINNHRYRLREGDTLINLGDVIMTKHHELRPILASIPGTKILIRGNHDNKTRTWYMNSGFSEVHFSMRVGSILLSHKPCMLLPDDVTLNIHGHYHANPERPEWYSDRHRHLSLEATDYMPQPLDGWK